MGIPAKERLYDFSQILYAAPTKLKNLPGRIGENTPSGERTVLDVCHIVKIRMQRQNMIGMLVGWPVSVDICCLLKIKCCKAGILHALWLPAAFECTAA